MKTNTNMNNNKQSMNTTATQNVWGLKWT